LEKIPLYSNADWKNVVGMASNPENVIVLLVLSGFLGVLIYRFVVWIMTAPVTPDPWTSETEQAVNQAEAVPLCSHCLTPQEHNGWFCPECGATVGPYCNYLPFVLLFSEGEVLRTGVTAPVRRSPLVTLGFVLLPLALFSIAAPFYWYFLFKNLRRSGNLRPEAGLAGS
jgi:hypothetical protein